MGRYIRKFTRASLSMGPSEERGYGLWVGYEIIGIEGDLSSRGFVAAEALTAETLTARGVTEFVRITPDDHRLIDRLGLNDLFERGNKAQD